MYKILNNVPDTTSCAWYRNLLPSIKMRDELKECNIQLDTMVSFDPSIDYDCFIFSRIPNNEDIFTLIDQKARQGKNIIWDMDDELWNIPKDNNASKYYTPLKLQWLNYYFPMSTRIVASTNNLAKSISSTWSVDPNKIVVLENLIDCDNYKKFNKGMNRDSGLIKILWTGSNSHEGDLEILDNLVNACVCNDNVQLIMFGYMPEQYKKLSPESLMFVSPCNRKYYEGTLSFISPTIALAPLSDNQFNRCKSAIKYYEMAMSEAICLASAIPPYSEVIEHRENGFLCSNVDDWVMICDELINNFMDRERIPYYGKQNVIENYSWNTDNKRHRAWLEFFKSIPDL